jgi:hypothetical protein
MRPYYNIMFCLTVQWSCNENFSPLAGEREILDMKHLECNINDLTQGCRYYFRVACGNLKGYGNFRLSCPASVIPSSKLQKTLLLLGKDIVSSLLTYRMIINELYIFKKLFQKSKPCTVMTFVECKQELLKF